MPQADPFGGWVSWPGYDALNLASIRIRRGGGQPSAGLGALGGIIELDSRQWPYETKLSAGLWQPQQWLMQRQTVSLVLAQGIYRCRQITRAGRRFYANLSARQRGSIDRGAKYQQAGLALRAVAPLSDDTELQANLRGLL